MEDDDEEAVEDFYRVPGRAPQSTSLLPLNNRDPQRTSHHSLSSQPIPLSRSNSHRTMDSEGDVLFDENDVAGGKSKYGVQERNSTGEDERSGLVGSNRAM